MKKVFSLGLLIAATMLVTFSSCKGNTPDVKKKVTGVRLNKNIKTVKVGEEFTLKAIIEPSDAENQSVTWESDKPDIAVVDNNGKVKGIKGGEASITVTTIDGGKTATCKVTVVATTEVAKVAVEKDKIQYGVGDRALVYVHTTPNAATKVYYQCVTTDAVFQQYGLKQLAEIYQGDTEFQKEPQNTEVSLPWPVSTGNKYHAIIICKNTNDEWGEYTHCELDVPKKD